MRPVHVGITGVNGGLGRMLCARMPASMNLLGWSREDWDIVKDQRPLKEASLDIIIHCAAFTNVDEAEQQPELAYAVNAIGTANVARYAQSIGAKLIYLSTDYVFEGAQQKPYTEQSSRAPRTIYGRSKLLGEQFVERILGTKAITIRTAWLYGGDTRQHLLTKLLELVRNLPPHEPLRVVDDQIGSPTYVGHLSQFIWQLIEQVGGELDWPTAVFHATDEGACSRYDVAKYWLSTLGIDHPLLPCTSQQYASIAPRPSYSVLSNECRLSTIGRDNNPFTSWQQALQAYNMDRAHQLLASPNQIGYNEVRGVGLNADQ